MTSEVHTPLKPISNGPKDSTLLATRPPPLVQLLPAKTSKSPAILCIRCRGVLPAHSTIRWCELCRQKQGEHTKLVNQGRAARAHGTSVFVPALMNTVAPSRQVATSHVDTDVKMADATGGPSTSVSPSRSNPGTAKRKADVMDSEAPAGKEQPQAHAVRVVKEFQTGQDLLDGLAKAMEESRAPRSTSTSSRPQYVNFHGSYTIVMDPDVRRERRVKQAVDELKQSAKLRFGDLVRRESEKSCGGYARTFWCACDPPPRPPKQPTPSPTTQDASLLNPATPTNSQARARPKRTQRTLVGWIAKSQSKEKLDNDAPPLPPPGCGGTITVYAVTDFSHPLGRMGIEGQKIAVHVGHPGRDFKRVLQ